MAGELRFDDRVAVVTGAGRGLGRADALLLASRGAKVLVNDLGCDPQGLGSDPGPAHEVVAEIERAGGVAVASFDTVATREGARGIVAEAMDRWGRVDILVSNAGGASGPVPIDALEEREIRKILDTHVVGGLFMLGEVWPHMVEQGYGRILNTSSGAALGLSGEYVYSAAKAALLAITKALAIDGAQHGIKVNAILPVAHTRLGDEGIPDEELKTWIRTTFLPEQVAAVTVALVHEQVPFSGEAISAGAGRAARVFSGIVPGFVDPDITPEQFLANVDTVLSTDDYIVATQTRDEGRFFGSPQADDDTGTWV